MRNFVFLIRVLADFLYFPAVFFFIIYLFYFVFQFVVVEYVGNVDWSGERAAEV